MITCSSDKIIYRLKSEAQAAAAGIWDEDHIKLTPYKCPECNFYHLATTGKGKTLRDIPHGLTAINFQLKKRKKGK